ncbi:cysteine desulfurase / selenocysteine lyase [Monaibacterium marinum]|uniref:cysteine desulfurase n=1 Tax=Pontivivens marinum TaxID=1690039 RepID=A0A2C9CQ86_9RHOB|nr:cysteine desulfurase [Monaibacterium marinum]SOH93701.1 cysteine desulfurase / selenocysteine lyase [Monaibacterium marinum]
MYDIQSIRADFPILSREVNGKPLVYLDNGASAQKPQVVIDAISHAYSHEYANVHRGLHTLSTIATENYEAVRGKIAGFLGGVAEEEIIFNTGATHGFNMISYGWAMQNLTAGDEIVLSVMEHHANIVPWHFLRERMGVKLVWVEPEADGSFDPARVVEVLNDRTKLVALTHMSNVLGTVVDIAAVAEILKPRGIPLAVDGSQASVHMPVDLTTLGADFYCITGHKLYGPSASGAVWIKSERMAEMRPFMGGGDMIRTVTRDEITYNDPPHTFEAGTPGIVQMIGLGTAIDYMTNIGMANIAAHEASLRDYAQDKFRALNWLNLQGTAANKGAIFSFTMDGGAHPHDISTIVDQKGVAVRAGHHCCQPLMQHLGVNATCRASFGMYNTVDEVDVLVDALETCHRLLG